MPNPLSDQSVRLDTRIACSNAALDYASSLVNYRVARRKLLEAHEKTGTYPPELHQAAVDAERASQDALVSLDNAVNTVVAAIA